MVIIRGDTHGDFDSVAHFCAEARTTKDDILFFLEMRVLTILVAYMTMLKNR